jgi:hypothetical protein
MDLTVRTRAMLSGILRALLVLIGAAECVHLTPGVVAGQVRVYDGPIQERDTLDPWAATAAIAWNSLSSQHCGGIARGIGGRVALLRRITERMAVETALQGSTARLEEFVGRPLLLSIGFRAHLPDPWGGFATVSGGAGSVDRWKDGAWTRTSAPGAAALIGWEFQVNDRVDLGGYWGYTRYTVEGAHVTNKSYGLNAVIRLGPTVPVDKPSP